MAQPTGANVPLEPARIGNQTERGTTVRLRTSTRDAVTAWLAQAQPLIGLREWEITVADDAAADDAWADIEAHSVDPKATLRIGAEFERQTPERQRGILAHELAHLIVHPLDQYTSHLEDQHGQVWWSAWEPGWDDHIEQVTEKIARAIAPRLPDFTLGAGTQRIERR
jgi:hypothetical protein